VLAYDTYLKLEQIELGRLREEDRLGTAGGQVAMSQLYDRTDLGLPCLTKAEGPEGIEEANFLYKTIEPATRPDDEGDGKGRKKVAVRLINDYRKVRKGHKKGGGGASEDDTSSMSEVSTNLFSASARAQQQPMPDAPAATTSLDRIEVKREGRNGDAEEEEDDDDMGLSDVLAEVKSSPLVTAAAVKKRKKVVVEEEEEEEEHDDDDMNPQQLLLAHVKAASPLTVPASSAAPTGRVAAKKKLKLAAEKRGGGGGSGGMGDGFVIPKKKQPKLADGALDEGRGGGGRGGEGGGEGNRRGVVDLTEARPITTATTVNTGTRAVPPPLLPSSSAASPPVCAPAAVPVVPSREPVPPKSSAPSTSTCHPDKLKRRLKVLKRPQAALAPVDVPFFLQAWGQIMGKDRQRVLEALSRSSDAVRAAFRCTGGLGGLVYWLHDQMSPRGLGAQENKVLQGEPGSAQIFIQMLRLAQGLVDSIADTAWNVEVGGWRASQAGPVLVDVEERLAPHIVGGIGGEESVGGIGGEEGKGEGGRGVWPEEAQRVATGVVRMIRAALAFPERYPTPQERARLATHPPQTPPVLLQPARVGGEAADNQHPAGASRAGATVADATATAVEALVRNWEGLRVSFKAGEGLRQVHNYTRLEMTADEEARRRSTPLMDVMTADDELDKALNCWVS